VDGEAATGIVIQAVGDGAVGGIRITGAGGDTDRRSDGRVLQTELAVALTSVTAPTSNSSTSLMAMVRTCAEKLPSLDVARTVIA